MPKGQKRHEQKQIITALGMIRPRFFISGTVKEGRPTIQKQQKDGTRFDVVITQVFEIPFCMQIKYPHEDNHNY